MVARHPRRKPAASDRVFLWFDSRLTRRCGAFSSAGASSPASIGLWNREAPPNCELWPGAGLSIPTSGPRSHRHEHTPLSRQLPA
jgi:hypothetical protein